MKFKKILIALCCIILCLVCVACNGPDNHNDSLPDDFLSEEITDNNDVTIVEPETSVHDFILISQSDGSYTYKCEDCGDEATVVITYISGTDNAYSVQDNTIKFYNVTEESAYDISGTFYGNIIIDVTDDYKFELQMSGLKLYSYTESPINVFSGDKVTLSAKKSTENFIYDMRDAVDETDETAISASVYAMCDFNVQGKGNLTVKSVNNNGIHTKDDLNVKNLTLQVDCKDNAIKGNDSVTIESGSLILIARQGDGIKTSNSDVSSKGNQRGTVEINGGDILIYAACDGIDAAYDVIINESSASVNLQIFTDKYSKYSEEVTAVADSVYYVRFNSTSYKFSLKFYNNDSDIVWRNSSASTVSGMYRYFSIDKPSGYAYVQLFIYSSSQQQGQDSDYLACTEGMAVNSNYDTIALQSYGENISYGWTNYTTSQNGFGHGGFGGMNDGNTDKGDYSTKGIKSDNEIVISAGAITISAYDDAIHANNDVALENGNSPLGNITISGGTLVVRSNDDGIHGDGTVLISGGTVNIIGSYEGIEGNVVRIAGGCVSVKSLDDGINGTATGDTGIFVEGGNVYVYSGGDGFDSNSTVSYGGIVFSGGFTVIISAGNSDSSIDTERGYSYNGGYVVGISRSGGMANEATKCSNFSSVGTSKTISLQKDGYLVVDGIATVKMPVSINALVVCLGKTGANISSGNDTAFELDANGIYWNEI